MKSDEAISRATALGLSTNEIQRRARLGNSFFWRWKTGKIKPRQTTIERIIDVLNEAEKRNAK